MGVPRPPFPSPLDLRARLCFAEGKGADRCMTTSSGRDGMLSMPMSWQRGHLTPVPAEAPTYAKVFRRNEVDSSC